MESSTGSARTSPARTTKPLTLQEGDIGNAIKLMTQVIRHNDAEIDYWPVLEWTIWQLHFVAKSTVTISAHSSIDPKKSLLRIFKRMTDAQIVDILDQVNTTDPVTLDYFTLIIDCILEARFGHHNRFEKRLRSIANKRAKKGVTTVAPKTTPTATATTSPTTPPTTRLTRASAAITKRYRSIAITLGLIDQPEHEMRAAVDNALGLTASGFYQYIGEWKEPVATATTPEGVDDINSRIRSRMVLLDAAARVEKGNLDIVQVMNMLVLMEQLQREKKTTTEADDGMGLGMSRLLDLFAFLVLRSGESEDRLRLSGLMSKSAESVAMSMSGSLVTGKDKSKSKSKGKDAPVKQLPADYNVEALEQIRIHLINRLSPFISGDVPEAHLDQETADRFERVITMLGGEFVDE